VTIAVDAADAMTAVVMDGDRVVQVLVNLVSNAIKHTPDGSTVTLRALPRQGGGVRIEVEDEGPGVPAGMEERIFERFQQLDLDDERRGTGLGLAISREIVERHGGAIVAVPGRRAGALFVVELPDGPRDSG
jgi:signal transduction histidine kinase